MKKLTCIALFLLTMISISSCQKDEKIDSGKSIDESVLMNYGWSTEVTSDFIMYDDNDPELNYTREKSTLFFLGNGIGIINHFQHYADTYFGTGNRSTPYGFEYEIVGNKVIISTQNMRFSCKLSGDYLVSDGGGKYEKQSISSSDREWIEENKYRILPDDKRWAFSFSFLCELEDKIKPVKHGNVTQYAVAIAIGIDKDQHAWERGITSIEAYYSISGGRWNETPKLTAVTAKGKGCQDADIIYIETASKAIITTRVRIYDSISKKYKEFIYKETIPGDDNKKDSEGDNSGNNDSGNNDSGNNDSGKEEQQGERVASGKENGYEWVDMGLSVKWATCNVGANKYTDYGDYFAWGETETYYEDGYARENPQSHWKSGKTKYSWENYKYCCNGDAFSMTKYCISENWGYNGFTDGKTVLELNDDAAFANWGGSWRMPTIEEIDELFDSNNCTWKWYDKGNSEFGGIAGIKVTSKKSGYAGNWIFLPAAGHHLSVFASSVGTVACYWSSSLFSGSFSNEAYYLDFAKNYVDRNKDYRMWGYSVRPVCQ